MTRVKICGVTNEDDLAAAIDAGADAVGLLVDVPVDSPREITPDRAAELARDIPPLVSTVLVTMPESTERTVELARLVDPDIVQVHGTSVGDLAYLAANVDANVVCAIDPEMERPERYDSVADGLLLDTATTGGTGETHDWDRARELSDSLSSPILLAGGLTSDNVAEAVEAVEPFAVDVASGVESSGGKKDHDALDSFVTNAKRGRQAVLHR